ncbi:hypothetical protein LWI28_027734 [Acer negundo]|uniref:Uncharacterized protein n=1 Tax=Acer negundo TaxID=4023 RepID=A0AAD5INA1_ACENE|nr:hypothetical protein LWI28_027734 [Acer negundo]
MDAWSPLASGKYNKGNVPPEVGLLWKITKRFYQVVANMAVSSKLILVMITLIFILVSSSQLQNHNHTKLELVHRDQISSSTKLLNHSHSFLARMQRDVKRVAAFTHLLSPAKSYEVENLDTDLVFGYNLRFIEYLVRVGIGSPPTF